MNEINSSYEILRIMKHVKDSVKQNIEKQFCELKLTGPQGMLVGILAHFGEMKVSDLSEKMGLSNSTVSGIIDRLENHGYVERTRSEEDRRVVIVKLTTDTKAKIKGHFQSMNEQITSIISFATQEELNKILIGFQTLDELITRRDDMKANS